MYTLTTSGKTISIFSCAGSECSIVYLNTFSNEGQKVFEAAQAASCPPFTLVAISDLDWNHDMVPWDSPPAFKNADPCTGGADDYLRILTEEIIPTAEKKITGVPCWRGIAGYSLAGLFALYSIYQTDLFSRVIRVIGFEPAASCSQTCVGTFRRHSAALFCPFRRSGNSSLALFRPACFKQNFLLLGWVWDWILYIKRSAVRGEGQTIAERAQEMRRINKE